MTSTWQNRCDLCYCCDGALAVFIDALTAVSADSENYALRTCLIASHDWAHIVARPWWPMPGSALCSASVDPFSAPYSVYTIRCVCNSMKVPKQSLLNETTDRWADRGEKFVDWRNWIGWLGKSNSWGCRHSSWEPRCPFVSLIVRLLGSLPIFSFCTSPALFRLHIVLFDAWVFLINRVQRNYKGYEATPLYSLLQPLANRGAAVIV